MSEMLLTVFREVINDLGTRLQKSQNAIDKCAGEFEEAERVVRSLEEQLKCADYTKEEESRKLDALTTYLNRVGQYPSVLREKLEQLESRYESAVQNYSRIDKNLDDACEDLGNKKTRLAVLKQEHAQLESQRKEVAKLVTQER